MRRRSPGWRTSRASSCTRTRCVAEDLDHPNELRVDLDPVPGVEWRQVQDVARVVRATLDDLGLVGWPKTSGLARYSRQRPDPSALDASSKCGVPPWRWRARSSGARRRIATSKWWKEERHGVFIDYNQNAKDRTVALGVLGAAAARRARLGAADLGRDRRVRSCGLHAEDDASVVRGERRSPRGHRPAPGIARRAARAVGAAGKGWSRRCAVAAAIREACPASRTRVQPSRARTSTGRRATEQRPAVASRSIR